MNGILEKIRLYGIMPIVSVDRPDDALPLARAFVSAGLPVMEVTFRTEYAEEAIRRISGDIPNMLIGAGTVLTPEQADRAKAAGAKFIVTPNIDPAVVSRCLEIGLPVLPGCMTPTDVALAVSLGLEAVKIFPVEAAGGVALLKSLSGPYKGMRYLPTGGIDAGNMLDYLALPCVLAVGGSFMADKKLIAAGDFAAVEAQARAALMKMYGFSLMHLGVNCPDEKTARKCAALMTAMFGFEPVEGPGAVFTGGYFEFMKYMYLGEKGHVAIGTNFLDRAMFRFESMGFEFNKDELKYSDKGALRAAYLKDDLFGFAFHLLQK
ncbi:MAG: bifunctional 4-hydroxy-2-oxoglutarate aldolase/2-dehydro-3-deoxy-phosphogluconate aldolase [Clostridiales bacterium]|nr:bifunctional 4-hydroxy-2-oxoglutarate aldolase/2-dehydro-3-deoxy-phosphogluconate aldolase [Clostridiales bacterium]